MRRSVGLGKKLGKINLKPKRKGVKCLREKFGCLHIISENCFQ